MEQISTPRDRETFEGETATFWFEGSILVALTKSVKRTVATIAHNVALVKRITGNKRVPLLIYLADSPVPDRAARQFSKEQLPGIYSAMAMVAKPGLSRLIMNILFALRPPPIPMKCFTDARAAKAWLQQFV